MKWNYIDYSDDESYLAKLGVYKLFKLEYKSTHLYYFKTDLYTTSDGFTIHASLSLNAEKEINITHARFFSTPDNWIRIEGSLTERKGKILQYLNDIGFTPAVPLLRQHRIDLLLEL